MARRNQDETSMTPLPAEVPFVLPLYYDPLTSTLYDADHVALARFRRCSVAGAIVAAVNERDSIRDSLQASQVAEQMARDDVRELRRELDAAHVKQIDDAGELGNLERELSALRREVEARDGWQPIEAAPKYEEVLLFRKDAGVMLGVYTAPCNLTPEDRWDSTASELGDSFEKEDWFLFCVEGIWRAEGSETPTHWRPFPPPPVPNVTGEKL